MSDVLWQSTPWSSAGLGFLLTFPLSFWPRTARIRQRLNIVNPNLKFKMVQNLLLSGLWCDSSGKSHPWPHVTGSNHAVGTPKYHMEWHPGHTYKMHMEGGLILCSDLGTIPKTLFDFMCAHSLGWSHWHLRHFWSQTFPVRDAQAVPRKEEQTASIPSSMLTDGSTKPCTALWCLLLDSALCTAFPWSASHPVCDRARPLGCALSAPVSQNLSSISWPCSLKRTLNTVLRLPPVLESFCVYVHVWGDTCEHVWTCMQRSKINFGCYPLGTIHFIILNFETGACWFGKADWPVSPRDLSVPATLSIGLCSLNLGSYDWAISITAVRGLFYTPDKNIKT